MPKTNDNTGATYQGMTGIVEHGAPINDGRTLSELDPERNLDGTLIDGEHPDRDEKRDGQEREGVPAPGSAPAEPRPIDEPAEEEQPERAPKREDSSANEKEEQSSPGFSSRASQPKTATTRGKNSNSAR